MTTATQSPTGGTTMKLVWTRSYETTDGRFRACQTERSRDWRLYDRNSKDDRGNTAYTTHRTLADAKRCAQRLADADFGKPLVEIL